MSKDSEEKDNDMADLPTRSAGRKTPHGFRVVHVAVPEEAFNKAKAQAYLSGMRFPDYLTRLLKEACPYEEPALPLNEEATSP